MPNPRHLVSQERLLELAVMAREGGPPDGALFELPCEEFIRILEHIEVLQETILETLGDFCELCGCTQHTACPEGCHWVAEGLCSSCQYQVEEADDDDGWQVVDLLTGEPLGDDDGPIIYMARKTAELSASMGVALFQVAACQACDWTGRYPEETGTCPTCGGAVRCLDEYRAVDGRRMDCDDVEVTRG